MSLSSSELVTSEYEEISLKSEMKIHISDQFPNSKEQLNIQFPTSMFPASLDAAGPIIPLVLATALFANFPSVTNYFDLFLKHGIFLYFSLENSWTCNHSSLITVFLSHQLVINFPAHWMRSLTQ